MTCRSDALNTFGQTEKKQSNLFTIPDIRGLSFQQKVFFSPKKTGIIQLDFRPTQYILDFDMK